MVRRRRLVGRMRKGGVGAEVDAAGERRDEWRVGVESKGMIERW